MGSLPKRLARVLRPPVEDFAIMELVANLKADHPAFGGELFQQLVRHIPWNVVEAAQTMMSRQDRIGTDVEDLADGFVGGVGNVDHHTQAIHLGN